MDTAALRTFNKGLLKTAKGPDGYDTFPKTASGDQYLAGDARINDHPSYVALATLLLREHNRIAKEYSSSLAGRGLSDDEIFAYARMKNIHQYQKITYYDFAVVATGKPVSMSFPYVPVNTTQQLDAPVLASFAVTAPYIIKGGHNEYLLRLSSNYMMAEVGALYLYASCSSIITLHMPLCLLGPIPLPYALGSGAAVNSIEQAGGLDFLLLGLASQFQKEISTGVHPYFVNTQFYKSIASTLSAYPSTISPSFFYADEPDMLTATIALSRRLKVIMYL
jgi:hypothetical protein